MQSKRLSTNTLLMLCLAAVLIIFMSCSNEGENTSSDVTLTESQIAMAPGVNGPVNDGAPTRKRTLTNREINRIVGNYIQEFDIERTTPAAISCSILDGTGAAVTTVQVATIGDPCYWFSYASGNAASNNVRFIALPLSSGNPMRVIFQNFEVAGSSSPIITPFGVPFSGGDATSGPWILIVSSDTLGTTTCQFTVVP